MTCVIVLTPAAAIGFFCKLPAGIIALGVTQPSLVVRL
jgi:hypothetical protein